MFRRLSRKFSPIGGLAVGGIGGLALAAGLAYGGYQLVQVYKVGLVTGTHASRQLSTANLAARKLGHVLVHQYTRALSTL